MEITTEALVASLQSHTSRWTATVDRDSGAPVRWFPMVRTSFVGGSRLGLDDQGRWVVGRPVSEDRDAGTFLIDFERRPGALTMVLPMLDWLPRRVVGDAAFVASLTPYEWEDVWDLVPWRATLRYAVTVKRSYLRAAVDWALFLGSFEDLRPDLTALLGAERPVDDGLAYWLEELLAQPPLAWPPFDSLAPRG